MIRIAVLMLFCLTAPMPDDQPADSIAESLAPWNQWRGPLGTGVAVGATPPVEWTTEKNVRWKTRLPGKGHSSPVLWHDRVFVTAAIPIGPKLPPRMSGRPGEHDNLPVDSRYQFAVIALDRRDGTILWQTVVREEVPIEAGHYSGSLASASPVTDGRFVFASFGAQGLYCLNMNGKVVWKKDTGPVHTKHGHGHGSSPALYGECLVLNQDHEDDSFLLVLEKTTGEEIWKKERTEDTSWSSPIVIERRDQEGVIQPEIVVCGTNRVRGYHLSTGKVLWECSGMSSNVVATPVYSNGVLYVGSSYEKKVLIAIKLEDVSGDLTGTDHVLWVRSRGTPYVPSMLLYDDAVYFLTHYQNVLTRVHGPTGEDDPGALRLGPLGNIYSSPVGANGHVYITDLSGTTMVITHASSPKLVAVNRLDEPIAASAAIRGDEIFLRGEQHLFCIGATE
ncbi:MAG: PQQ-binding-like beta-propeller repeat protein [Planctomycetaceae bacterium]